MGKDLHFAIAGVGEADGTVTFYKVNKDGDFYASFGLQHQCVIVKTGAKPPKGVSPLALAFVSPKNGKVYRTWDECQSGR